MFPRQTDSYSGSGTEQSPDDADVNFTNVSPNEALFGSTSFVQSQPGPGAVVLDWEHAPFYFSPIPSFISDPWASDVQITQSVESLSQGVRSSPQQPIAPGSVLRTVDVSARQAQCRWGEQCRIMLDDLSPSGIARHLKIFHFQDPSSRWDNRSRGPCEWHGGSEPCHRPMYYASYGKHIAAVHLGAIARQCYKCGRGFVRPDTLDRHLKRYCRGSSS